MREQVPPPVRFVDRREAKRDRNDTDRRNDRVTLTVGHLLAAIDTDSVCSYQALSVRSGLLRSGSATVYSTFQSR